MWSLHEAYDPARRVLTLDLVQEDAAPDLPDHLRAKTFLGSFPDLDEARAFLDSYLKTVAQDLSRVVQRVDCGRHRTDHCLGPDAPCSLGLDHLDCLWRA